MPRIPFPSTGKKNFTTKEERNAFFPLFRGAKRARRDALKDVANSVPITILKRPTPPVRQLLPPARQPLPPPPLVSILQNPNRQAATAQAPSSPNASASPIPAPIARTASHVSFASELPAEYSPRRPGGGRTAPSHPRTGFNPELMVRLPKVVIHEPVWWDFWTDVHHPVTSHGKLLDVPSVNWRGKIDVDDFARYFPKEHSAAQTKRMLRYREHQT